MSQYEVFQIIYPAWKSYRGRLSSRAINALARNGVTPEMVPTTRDADILAMRNVGRTTLREIRDVLGPPAVCEACGRPLA